MSLIQAGELGGRMVQWWKGTACHHTACHLAGKAKRKLRDEVGRAIPD